MGGSGPRLLPVRRLAAITASAGSVAACGASDGVSPVGTASPATAGQPGRTVLVLTQTLGFHHASIPWAVAALRRVAARDGRYRVAVLPSAARLTGTALKGAAAVVFLLTTGELPISVSDKHALVNFVHAGGGLIGFHSATDTFHRWPGYITLIGAEFSHHPVPSTERVVVEDRSTPATRSLPASFEIHEEFYVFKHDPRPHVHVLVRLDTSRGGPDRPLVWCRRSGRGRVFYDALGHFPQTWSDPRQLVLVSGGIAWAAGLVRAPSC
jgi:type 1 glutamine amidotransferase